MTDIRVAIFEDNKLVRDALETIIDSEPGFICSGAFSDGNNWLQDIIRSRPDVVLMDIEMPGLDGIAVSRELQIHYPDIKILIQTVFNDSEKVFNALCAGASGYILKNDTPQKYLDAISEVYNGGSAMNSAIAKKILSFFSSKNVILIAPENTDYQLSQRERETLQMMVKGINYRTIADNLFISYETVRSHVKNIYKKLHVTSRSEAIQKAIQQGLK